MLCQQIVVEKDPDRFSQLIMELHELLERQHQPLTIHVIVRTERPR